MECRAEFINKLKQNYKIRDFSGGKGHYAPSENGFAPRVTYLWKICTLALVKQLHLTVS